MLIHVRNETESNSATCLWICIVLYLYCIVTMVFVTLPCNVINIKKYLWNKMQFVMLYYVPGLQVFVSAYSHVHFTSLTVTLQLNKE